MVLQKHKVLLCYGIGWMGAEFTCIHYKEAGGPLGAELCPPVSVGNTDNWLLWSVFWTLECRVMKEKPHLFGLEQSSASFMDKQLHIGLGLAQH